MTSPHTPNERPKHHLRMLRLIKGGDRIWLFRVCLVAPASHKLMGVMDMARYLSLHEGPVVLHAKVLRESEEPQALLADLSFLHESGQELRDAAASYACDAFQSFVVGPFRMSLEVADYSLSGS